MTSIAKLKDRARKHELKEDWQAAIEAYQKVLEAEEGTDELELELGLFNRIGDLYLRLGKTDQAVSFYEQAAEKYAQSGFFNNAIALCNKALRHRPGRTQIYLKLSRLCAEQGFVTDARRWVLEYAEREVKAGRLDTALNGLTDFVESSSDADVREFLAAQLATHGREAEAAQHYAKAHAERLAAGEGAAAAEAAGRARAIDPDIDLDEFVAAPRPGDDLPGLDPGPGDAASEEGADSRGGPRGGVAGLERQAESDAAPEVQGLAGLESSGDAPVPEDDVEEEALPGLEVSHSERGPEVAPEEVDDTGTVGGLETFGELEVGQADEEAGVGPGAEDEDGELLPDMEEEAEPLPFLSTEPFDDDDEDEEEPEPLPILAGTEPAAEATEPDLERPEAAEEALEEEVAEDEEALEELEVVEDPWAATEPDPVPETPPADEAADEEPWAVTEPEEEEEEAAAAAPEEEPWAVTELEEEEEEAEEEPWALTELEEEEEEAEEEPWALTEMEEEEAAAEEEPWALTEMEEEEEAAAAAEEEPWAATEPEEEEAAAEEEPWALTEMEEEEAAAEEEPWAVTEPEEDEPLDLDLGGFKGSMSLSEAAAQADGSAAADLGPADPEPADIDSDAVLERARELVGRGLTDEALRELEVLPETAPEEATRQAVSVLAEIASRNADDLAVLQRRVALAMRIGTPDLMVPAYLDLAGALSRSGEEAKARGIYERVLDLDASNVMALEALGPGVDADATTGGLDLLLTEIQGAEPEPTPQAADDSADPEFMALLSQFKARVAQNVNTEDAGDHYDLGLAFKEMGLVDEAIAEFQTALTGGEERLKVYEELGQCFILKTEYTVALKIFERALQVPHHDEAELLGVYYHLGQCHEELGHRDRARAAYEKVLAIDPSFQDVPDRMARL